MRKKQVLIEFIQDVIKKFAREGGSKVNVLLQGSPSLLISFMGGIEVILFF